jgi:hypothetical protein
MAGDRLLRILALLPAFPDAEPRSARLCEVAAEVASMSGAGIMLMAGEVNQGSLCSSNKVSASIEDFQYTLGEGPCVDAYNLDQPVHEPDLADPDTARWIAFSPLALKAGARAVFGFPIKTGTVRLGALNLYRDAPGDLSADQLADSLVMADVAARAVVAMQATATPGKLPAQLEGIASLRAVVHQATGMVSAQLEVGVAEALVRIRAFAFSAGRSVEEVAQEIVARQLRFDER